MSAIQRFVRGRNVSGLPTVTAAIERAMVVHDKLADEHSTLAADLQLSDLGKKSKIGKVVLANVHEVIRIRAAAAKAKDALAKRAAALQPPPIDRTDVAGAVLRGQFRDRIAKMSPAEQRAFLPTADPAFWSAVLEAPALCGTGGETLNIIHNLAIEHAHPGALARLQHDRDAVQLLDTAATVLAEYACEIADLQSVGILDEIIAVTVPDTRHLDAEAERSMAPLANYNPEGTQ